jgi:membrane protease YdiL (CAAX protease family)
VGRSPVLKRLSEFLRSVTPADPAQLVFLCGIVCLVVAPHLQWSPEQLISPQRYQFLSSEAYDQIRFEWFMFLSVAVYPIIFAAMAGYFACFWPGVRPARRILNTVLFPAAFGLLLICGRFFYLNRHQSSLLESGTDVFYRNAISFVPILWRLGPGFHYCLLGTVLIAVFTWRLRFGNSSLPVTLAKANHSLSDDPEPWPRMNFLIWVLVGPLFVLHAVAAFPAMIPYLVSSHVPAYLQSSWYARMSSIPEAAILLGFALYTVGREGRRKAWNSLQLRRTGVFFTALVVPIGIAASISIGHFAFDRVGRVAHDFGNSTSPQIGSYFNLPDPWLMLLFFAALAEEVIFRGLLQPRFIKRYGLYQGIFLLGVVWAAFHFFSDRHSGESDLGVLINLASRVFMCVGLGYGLSWMTLRSGSVLPAAFAHTLYNVMVFSPFGPAFYGKEEVRVGLWAVLAYVLFHYWPVQTADEPRVIAAVPEPEIGL